LRVAGEPNAEVTNAHGNLCGCEFVTADERLH
jgi:hypothetical protein